jgi:hypothetical protein
MADSDSDDSDDKSLKRNREGSYVTKFSGITPESVHTLQQMSYNKLMADFLVCAAC